MELIDQFMQQYNKEYDYYYKVAQTIATKLEDRLVKRGIKAIVTYRAKRPNALKEKIMKRNKRKKYHSIEDIVADIKDLSGVRVSLYFPSERDIIDEIINELFIVGKIKKFPEEAHKPKYTKRFSGYWATHYQVKLKHEDATKRYVDTTTEIQVASILMHAWSEVEHDLVYKPVSGNLSREEHAILDEINGLVMSGEIALERLQSAIAERTKIQKTINNNYELSNYLITSLKNRQLQNMKLGETDLIYNFSNTINKISPANFNQYIKRLNTKLSDSVADQLLYMLILGLKNQKKGNLIKYFENLNIPQRRVSSFELFIRIWITLEKAVQEILRKSKTGLNKSFKLDFDLLKEKQIINPEEYDKLNQFRQIRNSVLHGRETVRQEYLNENIKTLKEITRKIINSVQSSDRKKILLKELEDIF